MSFGPEIIVPKPIGYWWRVAEKLRLEHNFEGARMPLEEFRDWEKHDWRPREKCAWAELAPLEDRRMDLSDEDAYAEKSLIRSLMQTEGRQDASWDSEIQLDALPKIGTIVDRPDPVEDFTTYNKVEGGAPVDLYSTYIDYVAYRIVASNVNKDFGADWVAGDFEHLWKWIWESGLTNAGEGQWGLATGYQDSMVSYLLNGPQLLYARHTYSAGIFIDLIEIWDAFEVETVSTANPTFDAPGTFWQASERDTAIAGPAGTAYFRGYTDAGRTILEGSCSQPLHDLHSFRWAMPYLTVGSSSSAAKYGEIHDMDYQQGGGAVENDKASVALVDGVMRKSDRRRILFADN